MTQAFLAAEVVRGCLRVVGIREDHANSYTKHVQRPFSMCESVCRVFVCKTIVCYHAFGKVVWQWYNITVQYCTTIILKVGIVSTTYFKMLYSMSLQVEIDRTQIYENEYKTSRFLYANNQVISHYLEMSIMTKCLPVIYEDHEGSTDCTEGQAGARL